MSFQSWLLGAGRIRTALMSFRSRRHASARFKNAVLLVHHAHKSGAARPGQGPALRLRQLDTVTVADPQIDAAPPEHAIGAELNARR